ncbi:MAG: NAD-binding protein [Anaerolineae bacterium]|nr:NAD-binding protein [Anaerolineae bacterium]
MDDLQRQFRIALGALLIIMPVGVIGLMLLEGLSFIDSLWLTFITLATIGYGDVYARTEGGRIFTIVLIVFGLSALASTLQLAFALFISPELRTLRQRRKIYRAIQSMHQHYIICGRGEMVDKTIGYILQFAESRRQMLRERRYIPIDRALDRVFGDDADGYHVRPRALLRRLILFGLGRIYRDITLLDVVVVITEDKDYAGHLRSAGLRVLEGQPTSDETLRQAGIEQARSMVVVLDDDTETLLTVLTAHHLNDKLPITAAVLDDAMGQKIIRVGATAVLTPYDIAGQFMNNATFRPAVNDYFNSLLFDMENTSRLTQIALFDDSPWIGQSVRQLALDTRFESGIIGIRQADGTFMYAPPENYVLQEDEVLIIVGQAYSIEDLTKAGQGPGQHTLATFQAIHFTPPAPRSRRTYSLAEAETAIERLSNHFIICGTDRLACSSIDKLDPERPFVIISDNDENITELQERGFRLVRGNPSQEDTLLRAGIRRAQAIMVSVEDQADSILTIINSRTLNRRILITATAMQDDMVDKLELAGADRVVSPFHVAARFILLTATRPEINEFLHYVLYNYQTRLETTELYMEESSPWIGRRLGDLQLYEQFQAGVIGIRQAGRQTYLYAPREDYIIQPSEVLIVVTAMSQSDALRDAAHGSAGKRPTTLRPTQVLQSERWSRDILKELIERAQGAD